MARVAPFFGSALAKVAKVRDNARKEIRTSRAAPKPLYRWERRRSQGASQHRPMQMKWSSFGDNPGASETSLWLLTGNNPMTTATADPVEVDANLDEAATELRQCAEPGHYTRYSSGSFSPTAKTGSIEFQIVLTEDEFKALKVSISRPVSSPLKPLEELTRFHHAVPATTARGRAAPLYPSAAIAAAPCVSKGPSRFVVEVEERPTKSVIGGNATQAKRRRKPLIHASIGRNSNRFRRHHRSRKSEPMSSSQLLRAPWLLSERIIYLDFSIGYTRR